MDFNLRLTRTTLRATSLRQAPWSWAFLAWQPWHGRDVFALYISGIYCQLGDYMPPTTLYGNQKQPLMYSYRLVSDKNPQDVKEKNCKERTDYKMVSFADYFRHICFFSLFLALESPESYRGGRVFLCFFPCNIYVPGSKLPLFPYNRGWSSTQ